MHSRAAETMAARCSFDSDASSTTVSAWDERLTLKIHDVVVDITINTEIADVTAEGISFLGEIIIFNPNNFQILIEDIVLTVESELNEIVGNIEITSGKINPNSYKNFTINGDLTYKTLDADIVKKV